jgi:hypothetical protein
MVVSSRHEEQKINQEEVAAEMRDCTGRITVVSSAGFFDS